MSGSERGSKGSLPRRDTPVEIVELDEMHTYVGQKKNYCRIWIAVDRPGKRYFDFVCGDRSTVTGLKLWKKLEGVRVRHYLARFKRRGLCYSKIVHMIEKSLTLLFLKLNNELDISGILNLS